jgi:hypothetical protein
MEVSGNGWEYVEIGGIGRGRVEVGEFDGKSVESVEMSLKLLKVGRID